jgi:2-polyprenyl-3-methyl-5-hydroxy-6-metoxy-1,4-benzoquinol methylase
VDLREARKKASELSGGTSSRDIKGLVLRCLREAGANGSLLDYGAGKGELLAHLHRDGRFRELAGVDLFQRPAHLPEAIAWYSQDLNDMVCIDRQFDTVVCSETIEHLENPRHVFRCLHGLLRPGGVLVLTMPNQESIRSYVGLLFGGHFTLFLASCYPAHITALVRLDLVRICAETGFSEPAFWFTDCGGIPKIPSVSWQSVSFGLLHGQLFSDNLGMIARKLA